MAELFTFNSEHFVISQNCSHC